MTWRNYDFLQGLDIYQQIMLLSMHGQSKDALAKTALGSWEYDIVCPGYKCNMTDILASIGLAQLTRFNIMLARRKQIIDLYNEAFEFTSIKYPDHYSDLHTSSGHLYLTRVQGIDERQRNAIIFMLAELGITTNVHYKPLPMHTAYRNLGFSIADFPNAFKQYQNEITLPLHTLLTDEQCNYIIDNYLKIVSRPEIRLLG